MRSTSVSIVAAALFSGVLFGCNQERLSQLETENAELASHLKTEQERLNERTSERDEALKQCKQLKVRVTSKRLVQIREVSVAGPTACPKWKG